MATMKRPRLQAVEPLDGYRLRLTFINGNVVTVSLADDFDRFPGLRPLLDPAVFATATLIAGEGWTVEWPVADVQIGAETLWLDAVLSDRDSGNRLVPPHFPKIIWGLGGYNDAQ